MVIERVWTQENHTPPKSSYDLNEVGSLYVNGPNNSHLSMYVYPLAMHSVG